MPAPVTVSDLDFLARTSLYGFNKPSVSRVAYYAGLLTVLRIALKFNVDNVTRVNKSVYAYISGVSYPRLKERVEFVKLVREGTEPKVTLPLSIFEDFGLSFGEPGNLYYRGMANGMTVALLQLPKMFQYLDEIDWRVSYRLWLDSKILYTEMDLENEKMVLSL